MLYRRILHGELKAGYWIAPVCFWKVNTSCWRWSLLRHQLAAVPVPSLLKYRLFLPPILGRGFGPAASFVMWCTT